MLVAVLVALARALRTCAVIVPVPLPRAAAVALGVLLLHALPVRAGDPPEALELREVLAAVLRQSPDLAAYAAEERAREAEALQAGVLPNPALTAEVEDVGGSGARRGIETTQTTISLSQLVELGGKRVRRRRLAALEHRLAGWDYETARLDALARATRAFVAVLAAQEGLTLADELLEVARESTRMAQRQHRAGGSSFAEITRAELALGGAELDRAEREQALTVARAELAASWGGGAPAVERVRGDLHALSEPPPLDRLLDAAIETPDVARWATELEQRHAALALERARGVPDVTLGVGGRRFEDTDDYAAVFGLSLPLPVFDRNQGAVVAAEQRLAKARAERAAAEAAVRSRLVSAHAQLRAAWTEARALESTILPRAHAALDGARRAFAHGASRFLEVVDAQRALFQAREREVAVLAAYHQAAADVERGSGVALTVPRPAGGGR